MSKACMGALLGCCLIQVWSSVAFASAERPRNIFVGLSPTPVQLPLSQAMQAARDEAAQVEGAVVVRGLGASMEPLFSPGALAVLAPIPYEDLKPGITVVYQGRSGRRVMHVLVANSRSGWRAAGLNNLGEDSDLVTPSNLLGVVTHVFQPEGRRLTGR